MLKNKETKEKPVRIAVQGHPGAKRNEVVRFEGEVWHLKIAAPATEGKANKALIEFLSEVLDISKSRITIDKGATGRHKLIVLEGITKEAAEERLGKRVG
jgi:uncharacterized protein (TIGR00251 family)